MKTSLDTPQKRQCLKIKAYSMNSVQRKVELITRIWRLLYVLSAACLVCDKKKVNLFGP